MSNKKQDKIKIDFPKFSKAWFLQQPDEVIQAKQDKIILAQMEILSRRGKSVSNTLLNQLCNNGSVMINTSIISKENESEIAWTIIDDPYIKRD